MFSVCPHSLQSRRTTTLYRREAFQRKSSRNLSRARSAASPTSARSYSPSDFYRQTLPSFPIRNRYAGISKARKPFKKHSSRSRSPPSEKGGDKQLSATSSVSSFIATPSSSCPSGVGRNGEPRTDHCQLLGQQTQIAAEVQSPGRLDDESTTRLRLLRESNTEYEANLAAASDETRHLFIEYYERAYGHNYVEEEDVADTYWKWDQGRQQWHHKNEDTGSEAWFLGMT
ncbi:hypothetical protein F5Y14DRAFT_222944 [Nemania sp. NC0429]|nr:hypothetical protein F5Y14DRAFT_222944 [Nemania sp. NC0429]